MTMAAAPPRHVKVTMYMPPDMLADLDVLRAELMRDGVSVDRGQMIRAAIRMAHGDPVAWNRALREDSG